MIRLTHLNKTFGKKEVLKDINTEYHQGLIYGIIGKNGAGKSTLFKCIAGLESYAGTIDYVTDNEPIQIGLLPTHPYMMSKITGSEYLTLTCNARKIDIGDYHNENIFKLPLDDYAEHYSTGMLKKLAITGILLQKNQVFILDEPFNGLDLESNLLLKKIILELKHNGKLILISSHILNSLYEISDCIHYLKDGRLNAYKESTSFAEIEADMTKGIEDISIEQWL